jgi:tetratricopeptide (TPR) repeat protein
MASNVPTISQISLISLFFQLLLVAFFTYFYHDLDFAFAFIFGALTYSILAISLRNFIAKEHRHGFKLVKQQKFAEAIPLFENSVHFFTQHAWVDKYRFLTLLSASKLTYKEMGLCNIAFCYSQTNNVQKAIEYYELVLKEFPNNGMAITGLRMINSIAQTQ